MKAIWSYSLVVFIFIYNYEVLGSIEAKSTIFYLI